MCSKIRISSLTVRSRLEGASEVTVLRKVLLPLSEEKSA